MLNVLSNGKQHDITIALMVKVQLFCGIAGSVSTTTKSFCGLSSCKLYLCKGRKFLTLHNVLFYLLNLMVVLQVY
jgi:hypothetical protein